MFCMEDKKDFRNKAKNVRGGLDVSFISKKITKNILLWDKYQKAQNVMLFYPINSEISLLNLLNDKNKSFYFPSICGNEIFPVLYSPTTGFESGAFGTYEAVGSKLNDFSMLDLILIPALAVDKKGFRLGYGKGFYDRFLEHISSFTIKAVPIASELVYENIPHETHDKTADVIVTENSILATLRSISNS